MEKQFDKFFKDNSSPEELLKKIVIFLRPKFFSSKNSVNNKLAEFIAYLNNFPEKAKIVNHVIIDLIATKDPVSLITESGVYTNGSFFKSILYKLYYFLLPPVPDTSELRTAFNEIFEKKKDYLWVQKISNEQLNSLWKAIFGSEKNEILVKQLWHGVEILGHRVVGISLDAELVARYRELDRSSSPFLKLQKLIFELQTPENNPVKQELIQVLNECDRKIMEIRKNQYHTGAGLSLSFTLQRLFQHTQRMRLLINYIFAKDKLSGYKTANYLFKNLVEFENKKYSFTGQIGGNLEILSYQITEHTGKTGEHYITTDEKGYHKMKYSAMGGGAIVGLLSFIKVSVYRLNLSDFGTSFLYSMNYSLGFIGIHLTHSTLATKQPAMTASKIAASLDKVAEDNEERMRNLGALIIDTFRSQFVAFVGNIFIAFPVAFILGQVYYWKTSAHIAYESKAWKMINELHPWESPALYHASIAGIFLFLSGVISGYYDNSVVFNNVRVRILNHPVLKRVFPPKMLKVFAAYVEHNTGVIVGNFILGILLGTAFVVGKFFGLSFDIRHITFASGNFGLAFSTLGFGMGLKVIILTIIGIVGIGIMNFAVSFGLAIALVIKSRRISFIYSRDLFKLLIRAFLDNPKQFFFPPKKG